MRLFLVEREGLFRATGSKNFINKSRCVQRKWNEKARIEFSRMNGSRTYLNNILAACPESGLGPVALAPLRMVRGIFMREA